MELSVLPSVKSEMRREKLRDPQRGWINYPLLLNEQERRGGRTHDLVSSPLTSLGRRSWLELLRSPSCRVPLDGCRVSAWSSTASPTDDQDAALEPITYHNWITIQSVIIIVLQASMTLFNHTQQGSEQELHIQPMLSYLFTRHCKLNLTPL